MTKTTITVCTTCRRDRTNDAPIRDGLKFANRVERVVKERGMTGQLTVRGMACMSACDNACAAQISGDGRFTYILAHLDPETAADDLVTMATTHRELENGLVVKSQRPPAIKNNVVTRVPPPGFEEFPLSRDWDRLGDDDLA